LAAHDTHDSRSSFHASGVVNYSSKLEFFSGGSLIVRIILKIHAMPWHWAIQQAMNKFCFLAQPPFLLRRGKQDNVGIDEVA
jgi:hypothetical protein